MLIFVPACFRSFWSVLNGAQTFPLWKTTCRSTTPYTLQSKSWWTAYRRHAAMRYKHTHTHHLSTSLCWELPFVTNLYCPLLLQAKVSPNFKSNYSETLAKLEHQYCKLLVSLTLRAVVLCAFEATLVSSVHPLPQLIPLDRGRTLMLKTHNYASALFLLLPPPNLCSRLFVPSILDS